MRKLRIPMRYLANLLTAGDENAVVSGLERMMAMRVFMRSRHVEGTVNKAVLDRVGLTEAQVEETTT